MDNRPIGFLDSGVGGLTVVRELMRQLPHEEIVYIGDSARAPYGPRPAEQIREYTWQLVNFLLTKDVKMIVIACNTATAVVWEEIKVKLDIPVLGVILPGASAAIKSSQGGKIGVIGTPMTVQSDIYRKKSMIWIRTYRWRVWPVPSLLPWWSLGPCQPVSLRKSSMKPCVPWLARWIA